MLRVSPPFSEFVESPRITGGVAYHRLFIASDQRLLCEVEVLSYGIQYIL